MLQSLDIVALNPMQEALLSKEFNLQNLVLLSPTGSGKTLALLLHVLQQLDFNKHGVQAIIVAPSRELVLQIETVFRAMKTGFKVSVCYGGHNSRTEKNRLTESPALIIGTPGRLADHVSKGILNAASIELVVIDEFDKSLQMGFHDQLEVLFMNLNGKQKHLFTSATHLEKIPEFIPFRNPKILNFLGKGINKNLEIKLVKATSEEKVETLVNLVASFKQEISLVFCNHRDAVERVSAHFKKHGIANGIFHGAMEQIDRERNLIKFRSGACHTLISTDLASRGLDIPEIRHVVHYQLPVNEESFIHRNGRTARMHAEGQAYLLLADNESLPNYLNAVIPELTINTRLKLPNDPEFELIYFSAGKKQKISKGDIAGILMKKGGLKSADIGLISITDMASYAAVKRSEVANVLINLKGEKLKKGSVKVEIAN